MAKRGKTVRLQLLNESKEAALNAIQAFNNPLSTFKTQTFIVLMVIAWRSLLHAHYRSIRVDYRLYDQKPQRRRFKRTKSGSYRYWSLAECLSDKHCPLDGPTRSNLLFLIGLRNEIEHHQSAGVDKRLSDRYLACCLNYERYLCQLFGDKHSLGEASAFTLQFRDLSASAAPKEAVAPLPSNVAAYLREFDAELPEEELNSPYFRYRLLFVPVVTSKKAQADEVVEFVPFESELGQSINQSYQQVVLKEVEREKHLPSGIVALMREDDYAKFNLHNHTQLWKELDAKNPSKGYGVMVASTWYWYTRWLEEVRKHCEENAVLYKRDSNEIAA